MEERYLMLENNAEIIITESTTWKQRFLFWLFKQFAKAFCKNPMDMVAGWWQAWMIDYKGWKYLKSIVPTNWYWVTESYCVHHYQQLCSIDDIEWGFSKPVLSKNEKGNRVAVFTVSLIHEGKNITTIQFKMVEKEHNYCII